MQRVVDKKVKRSPRKRFPALPKENQLEMPAPKIEDASKDHEVDPQYISGSANEVIINLNEPDEDEQFVIRFEDSYSW